GVRPQAAVIVELPLAGPGRRAVQAIAAMSAHQHSLKQARFDRAPRGKSLVFFQLLLGQTERSFADQRRHSNLDPLFARSLLIGSATLRVPTLLPQRTGHFPSGLALRLAETRSPHIRRIPKHRPHGTAFPSRVAGASGNLPLIQRSRDRSYTALLNGE